MASEIKNEPPVDETKIPSIPEVLSCVLFRDTDTQQWVGHCLDFDLVTSGKNEDSAWGNLIKVVRAHIEHCFTFHPDGLKLEASPEEWAVFRAFRKRQKNVRSEKITLRLVTTGTF